MRGGKEENPTETYNRSRPVKVTLMGFYLSPYLQGVVALLAGARSTIPHTESFNRNACMEINTIRVHPGANTRATLKFPVTNSLQPKGPEQKRHRP